jgi:hypothetical protein
MPMAAGPRGYREMLAIGRVIPRYRIHRQARSARKAVNGLKDGQHAEAELVPPVHSRTEHLSSALTGLLK